MGYEAVDHVGDVAFHDAIELVQSETDPVIGEAILGEIVSADFFAAIAASDLRFAILGDGVAGRRPPGLWGGGLCVRLSKSC